MGHGKVGDSGRDNIAQDGGVAGGVIRLFFVQRGRRQCVDQMSDVRPGTGRGNGAGAGQGIEKVVYVREDIGKVGHVWDSFGNVTRDSRS